MYSNQIPSLFCSFSRCPRRLGSAAHGGTALLAGLLLWCRSVPATKEPQITTYTRAGFCHCSPAPRVRLNRRGQGRRHCTPARRLRLLAGPVDTPLSGRPTQQAPAQLSTSKSLTPGRCVPRSACSSVRHSVPRRLIAVTRFHKSTIHAVANNSWHMC